MGDFYTCGDVLSKKDMRGENPELILCVGNRTGGKTTAWNSWVFRKWMDKRAEFALIYRYANELKNVCEKFFGDIRELFFPGWELSEEVFQKDSILRLVAHKEGSDVSIPCGFAICLNKAKQVKLNSHVFSRVENILFDEFQPEDNRYLATEVNNFMSIHTSIARGRSQMRRFVRAILISNPVTILNPYYSALGITRRLKEDTKYMKGDGFIFEHLFNEKAAQSIMDSGVARAFAGSDSFPYLTQMKYLLDVENFLGKPEGRGFYLMTLVYEGKEFGVYEYPDAIYVSDRPDRTSVFRYSASWKDHRKDTISMSGALLMRNRLIENFSVGRVRFQNLECRDAYLCACAMKSLPV